MDIDEGGYIPLTEWELGEIENAASSGDFADACEEYAHRLIAEVRDLRKRVGELAGAIDEIDKVLHDP